MAVARPDNEWLSKALSASNLLRMDFARLNAIRRSCNRKA
jgi:hypothetical protein